MVHKWCTQKEIKTVARLAKGWGSSRMNKKSRIAEIAAAALMATAIAMSSNARADGYEVAKAAPAEESRKFTYSFTLTGTSDYMFRGISQTDNDPAIQGSIDIGYGTFYAGIWSSNVELEAVGTDAQIEIDYYAGLRPVWGPLTFDLGILYYSYPGANWIPPIDLPTLNYWELKAGVSGSPVTNLALGGTVYYAWDYSVETGPVWTLEGNAAYTFHAVGPFTPTVNAVVGYQTAEENAFVLANGYDNYWYWNAGLALAVEKITFDFRYWDTQGASNPLSDTLTCINSHCDERFVFSAKVTLP